MEVDKFLVISCEALDTAILEVKCALAFQELKNFFLSFYFCLFLCFLFTVLLKPVSLGFYPCTQKIPKGQNGMAWSCPFLPVTTFPFISALQPQWFSFSHSTAPCAPLP